MYLLSRISPRPGDAHPRYFWLPRNSPDFLSAATYDAAMRYRLIAIDLDGTLLCPEGRVSAQNLDALHQARAQGVHVLPCTGRGWREARSVIGGLPDADWGVYNTGAMISRTVDGATVDAAPLDRDTVLGLIALLRHRPEAILLHTDPDAVGLEYLVTGDGRLTDNTRWWFEHNGLRYTETPSPEERLLDHVVRVGLVLPGPDAVGVQRLLDEAWGGRVEAHAFAAVQQPGGRPMHILEIFAPGVTKWRGIEVVARHLGIDAPQIAVIGDQVNDLPMIHRAGCAVAMGNAVPQVKDAAHHHTTCNRTHGVAHAVGQMLAGAW